MISDKAYSVAMSAGYIPVPRKDGKPQWEKDFIHPSFWKCLSKALGWDKIPDCCAECGAWTAGWGYRAHRFYDLILTGGDMEKFWKELLPTNE